MRYLSLVLLAWLLGGCSLIQPPPELDLAISKQGPWQAQDRIEWVQQGNRLWIEIYSPAGVGSARLHPLSGAWPDEVHVRLHLTALEGLLATTGAERFDYRLERARNNQRTEARARGEALEPIEVELPAVLFQAPDAPLILQWVDFYR